MTYSPGGPGYPPAQSRGSYGGSTPSFTKDDADASKLPLYLMFAVAILGLGAYLAFFGPIYSVNVDIGPASADVSTAPIVMAIVAALLAALLGAISLLPKAKNYTAVVGTLAALGALLVIAQTFNTPSGWSIGWALWLLLACSIFQAFVAVTAVLLDAGVVTAPPPRPKYDPYGPYGQYGQYGHYGAQAPAGYYSQPGGQQHAPVQQHGFQQSPQPPGYGPQYGGYTQTPAQAPTLAQPMAPPAGGFGAAGAHPGPPQGQDHGTSTPPTGFPSFAQPPSGAGAGSAGVGVGMVPNQGDSNQGQQSQGQGQTQSSSIPSGPTPA